MADTRDWDKEMAAIDKVISKGGYVAPGGGAPAPAPSGGGSAPVSPGVPAGSRAWMGIWVRTLLGLALAFGLFVWPWTRPCGFNLYWFLSATGVLALTGAWVMIVSWRGRSALSHVLGLLMLGYATWLGAVEILPRTGYARSVKTWSCPATPPTATTVQP